MSNPDSGKNISVYCLLKLLPSVLSVNTESKTLSNGHEKLCSMTAVKINYVCYYSTLTRSFKIVADNILKIFFFFFFFF